jgi:flagellar P-ring protein precursor FlgI
MLGAIIPAFGQNTDPPPAVRVRIKDLTHLRGVCDNQLIGYGIVAGLNGTGDRKGLPDGSLANLLNNLGVVTPTPSDFKPKNMAAVMVTASLPPFAKSGDVIDVTVASIGDATSIEGGMLFMTQLKAANGVVYATAQGPVSIGGLNVSGGKKAESASKNWALVGRIAGGGLVCKDMHTELTKDKVLHLVLNDPDFDTAFLVAQAINEKMKSTVATAVDAQTLKISIPFDSPENAVEFITKISGIEITPQVSARVVLNERTGTVVVGRDVKILPVAISHGNIRISVGAKNAGGKRESDGPDGGESRVFMLPGGTDVKTLVEMLNQIGATPKDIIAIFQALRRACALQAELVIF